MSSPQLATRVSHEVISIVSDLKSKGIPKRAATEFGLKIVSALSQHELDQLESIKATLNLDEEILTALSNKNTNTFCKAS